MTIQISIKYFLVSDEFLLLLIVLINFFDYEFIYKTVFNLDSIITKTFWICKYYGEF